LGCPVDQRTDLWLTAHATSDDPPATDGRFLHSHSPTQTRRLKRAEERQRIRN
jgi:hypothetical protein